MEKCIIAAVASDGAIGKGNDLLWHISQDLRNFKAVTGHSPIIMGRKTFESLGSRPLPGRRNIVLSRSLAGNGGRVEIPGIERYPDFIDVVGTLDEAYDLAEKLLPDSCGASARCFVIGGSMVYSDAMESADRLFITHIDATVESADRFFPEISPLVWKKLSESETFTDPKSGVAFRFAEYVRAQTAECRSGN